MPTPTHARMTQPRPTLPTPRLHCACCGRPFVRSSSRGPVPLYCSADCRTQMRIRQRVWSNRPGYAAGNTAIRPEPRFGTAHAS
ncbi:hypothetical protein [Azospirillum isscasi]|uniref:DUF2256 domain-containing protein n=1 Tax=Azospirillum isscasi TaxID=3053926 RepID=A0ABU0WA65_9PROT|nr:hypothetical protein [Azospirillum isscasi]MDQ2101080.1 hypothetical protein [Azospirillum isscasi]